MHCRRRPNVNNHRVTSESSCTSPIDTDNDRPFEPDSSGTDLTEPEYSPGVERIYRARYQVPDDDTDEDLAQVPEDYGRSNDTKKLKHRLKESRRYMLWAFWRLGGLGHTAPSVLRNHLHEVTFSHFARTNKGGIIEGGIIEGGIIKGGIIKGGIIEGGIIKGGIIERGIIEGGIIKGGVIEGGIIEGGIIKGGIIKKGI
ncbi:hypothetical protein BO71DRAFT_436221 [Aspergillus ellipticus CBS 707.79]|uniref:Uncharacterized protein n=1 Tax=Aspergillus ellipticus CBS 707.79 TaxID=1448320 RepID=A0A319CRI7_9EURO|nr:hypothetical protein BO71DRAFT_436221 [Aspergillus ellipticus CBS 707.79]